MEMTFLRRALSAIFIVTVALVLTIQVIAPTRSKAVDHDRAAFDDAVEATFEQVVEEIVEGKVTEEAKAEAEKKDVMPGGQTCFMRHYRSARTRARADINDRATLALLTFAPGSAEVEAAALELVERSEGELRWRTALALAQARLVNGNIAGMEDALLIASETDGIAPNCRADEVFLRAMALPGDDRLPLLMQAVELDPAHWSAHGQIAVAIASARPGRDGKCAEDIAQYLRSIVYLRELTGSATEIQMLATFIGSLPQGARRSLYAGMLLETAGDPAGAQTAYRRTAQELVTGDDPCAAELRLAATRLLDNVGDRR